MSGHWEVNILRSNKYCPGLLHDNRFARFSVYSSRQLWSGVISSVWLERCLFLSVGLTRYRCGLCKYAFNGIVVCSKGVCFLSISVGVVFDLLFSWVSILLVCEIAEVRGIVMYFFSRN